MRVASCVQGSSAFAIHGPLVLRAWCKRHASGEGAQDRGDEERQGAPQELRFLRWRGWGPSVHGRSVAGRLRRGPVSPDLGVKLDSAEGAESQLTRHAERTTSNLGNQWPDP